MVSYMVLNAGAFDKFNAIALKGLTWRADFLLVYALSHNIKLRVSDLLSPQSTLPAIKF